MTYPVTSDLDGRIILSLRIARHGIALARGLGCGIASSEVTYLVTGDLGFAFGDNLSNFSSRVSTAPLPPDLGSMPSECCS